MGETQERRFCVHVFRAGFMQKVKMSWGQRDGYGPGNGEGFLEGVCMCLCVCVYVCQNKPKTGSRVSRGYMAQKIG